MQKAESTGNLKCQVFRQPHISASPLIIIPSECMSHSPSAQCNYLTLHSVHTLTTACLLPVLIVALEYVKIPRIQYLVEDVVMHPLLIAHLPL
jgi:hypothetical protein